MLALLQIAVEVRLLPDPIDLNFVLAGSGLLALLAATPGVLAHWPTERTNRWMLYGMVLGGTLAGVALFALLLLH